MYFPSLSGTLGVVSDVLSVRKRSAVHDHHRIDRFGRLLLVFQESIKHVQG